MIRLVWFDEPLTKTHAKFSYQFGNFANVPLAATSDSDVPTFTKSEFYVDLLPLLGGNADSGRLRPVLPCTLRLRLKFEID
jgi:hypothetical protein